MENAASPRSSRFRRVVETIPTLLILTVLGVFGWWGHRTGWTIPKFSELRGNFTEDDDWCAEHGVPESICIECDETLVPKGKSFGWCKIHGVAECPHCHPSLAEVSPPPMVTAEQLAKAQRALELIERPENNPICRKHTRRIQFVDAEAVDRAGIVVQPVSTDAVTEILAVPGEIGFDQNKIAHLSSRCAGTVWQVYKHLGDSVQKGDLLALIDAAEVGKAKTELLQAFANQQLKLSMLNSLKESQGSIPDARIREAESALKEAEIRTEAARQSLVNLGFEFSQQRLEGLSISELKSQLHFLGIPTEIARSLDPKKSTTNLLPLLAPFAGTLHAREVVMGEVVDPSRIIFEIVDRRSLWLTFDVKLEEAHRVRLGQTVRFLPDGRKTPLVGKISWISAAADPKTRTLKLRADVQDLSGSYQANTFGKGEIILREENDVVMIPNEALQWEGCCQIVFVRDRNYLHPSSPKFFHVRKVRVGAKGPTHSEIIAGLLPEEVIVTRGSGLLLTELLRSNLGEGCACHSKK